MKINIFSKIILVIILCSIIWASTKVLAEGNGNVYLTSPRSGESIKGNYAISGSVDIDGFSHFELAFAYENSNSTNWFPIASSETRVKDGIMAYWTTNLITDGIYRLRLRVFLLDGSFLDVLVTPVAIQNDIASTIATPIKAETNKFPLSTEVATITVAPTATEMPENPAILSSQKIEMSIGSGILIVLVIVLCTLFFSSFRK